MKVDVEFLEDQVGKFGSKKKGDPGKLDKKTADILKKRGIVKFKTVKKKDKDGS